MAKAGRKKPVSAKEEGGVGDQPTRVADGQRVEEPVSERVAASDEQIRVRAYELYIERGRAPGADVEDWLRAEREYRERSGAAPRRADNGEQRAAP